MSHTISPISWCSECVRNEETIIRISHPMNALSIPHCLSLPVEVRAKLETILGNIGPYSGV